MPAGALTGGAGRAGPRADARGAGLYAAMAQRGAAPRLVILTVGRRAPPRACPGRHTETSVDAMLRSGLVGWDGLIERSSALLGGPCSKRSAVALTLGNMSGPPGVR